MHILILALHRPSKPTGVCRHAVNLARCLIERHEVNKVTLLVGDWQTQYFEDTFQLSTTQINVINISIKNSSLSRNLWFLFGLPKIAKHLRPDIIHLSFPIPFIRQWFAVPVVATIHDLYPYDFPDNFGYPQVWFNRLFLRLCIGQSNGLSCVSKVTFNSLLQHFPNVSLYKKVEVIYNYVDFSDISPKTPQKFPLGENESFILCVAQHRKNKNLSLLINAYDALQKSGILQHNIKLLIVGNPGPETERLCHQIQALALQNQVILLSSIDDGELCWLYKNCILFVIPSSTEGFCLPLVEALSLSPRIVCSNIPIFQEVGSSKCYYFDLDNQSIQKLSDRMASSLLSSPCTNPSPDVRFSRLTVAQRLFKFYDSIQEAQTKL
jgi:glycosyltransferase involved in cell wall biosynthesis